MTCMIDISSLSSQLLVVTVGSVQFVLSTHVQTCSFCLVPNIRRCFRCNAKFGAPQNVWKSKPFRAGVPVQYGPYRKVPIARSFETSLMTSRDYDVIYVRLQSLKSLHLETMNRIDYPCEPFKHTIS